MTTPKLNKFVDYRSMKLKSILKWFRSNLIQMMIFSEVMMKKERKKNNKKKKKKKEIMLISRIC